MADSIPQVQIELPADVEMEESTALAAEENPSAEETKEEGKDKEPEVQETPAEPEVPTQQSLFLNYLTSPIVQLVLGKGEEQTTLTAHQAVLEPSPFFAEKLSQCEQTGDRRIYLEDEYTDTVACFLQYQYTGEYFPRLLPSGKDLEQDPAIPKVDSSGDQLLKHARIYSLAEKLGNDKLKLLAQNKIGSIESSATGEIAYARYVYSHTTPDDTAIRGPVARFWAKMSDVLRHDAEEEFRALCLEHPQFSFDLLNRVLDMKEKRARERDNTSSPAFKGPARKRSRAF
ncbi:hypothetical protein MGYG_00825 [Nannizzia gypsea CBS 118893]|uniref:BTB domain-containing protein n=1 Tax=Arthroderma gypseum (strain ATCC MYA-4604 / CBS 118893) TaxID=535722 RepID=E5R206_ARTGP|nr:hypothetical protein MGYG_00825 [Nannizzia gypsea CBS 118893]EFQ97785.1 hypothetical protein MGYG_00825 [Nannizzia gypsea CBS 118893]